MKKTIHIEKRTENDVRQADAVLPGPPDKNYETDFLLAPIILVFQVILKS